MGKGDKKSKRGKLFQGSYGVRRRKKGKKTSFIKPREVKEPVKEAIEVKEVKATQQKAAKAPVPKKETKSKKTETT